MTALIPITEAERLERHQPAKGAQRPSLKPRLRLIPFEEITVSAERRYLVKGWIPRVGLTIVWGPPKCGKSFWTFDVAMHVALGWQYRGRRVQPGPVVYCAFEGQTGLETRVEAFRRTHLVDYQHRVPFSLEPVTLDLVNDHPALIELIAREHRAEPPALVVLDTLNRSMRGSESSDEDMAAYIAAADTIRDAFQCAVLVVHHCGHDGSRPRGHSSLPGAVEAQIGIRRDAQDHIIAELELMKDGPEGEKSASRLIVTEVGTDEDGDPITSCTIEPVSFGEVADARAERGASVSRTLKLFIDTFQNVLVDAGKEIQPYPDASPVRAVNVEVLRKAYYARRADDSTDTKRKAFNRQLGGATEQRLLCAASINGVDWVWQA